MDNIIQQFKENITLEITKELNKVFKEGNSDISKLIRLVDDNLKNLGCNIIKYVLEESDKAIKDSSGRKKRWVVQNKDVTKTLITEFGEVRYVRTYYKSKRERCFTYLVDDHFGIERYQRIDKGLAAKMIELSKEYSYQKSADLAVKSVDLSRQTVQNKIRELGNIESRAMDEPGPKKHLKRLYIEADEDHLALQSGSNAITKLVYVHEGKEKKNNRSILKNPYYFSGLYRSSEQLWLEVIEYIDDNYEMDEIETIYLAGDGAPWIKEGLNWIPKVKYVLDKYHLNKYVLKATGHMPRMRPKLWDGLNRCDQETVREIFKEIIDNTLKETKKKAVKESKKYILENWYGIKRHNEDPYALGCSAEGHVSHVLSQRMSSRPLGWSRKGAEQMSRLRAFKYNGGSREKIYELLTEQKKKEKLKLKVEKILKKTKKKTLYPEAKETMPALKRGKVDGTFKAIRSLAF